MGDKGWKPNSLACENKLFAYLFGCKTIFCFAVMLQTIIKIKFTQTEKKYVNNVASQSNLEENWQNELKLFVNSGIFYC